MGPQKRKIIWIIPRSCERTGTRPHQDCKKQTRYQVSKCLLGERLEFLFLFLAIVWTAPSFQPLLPPSDENPLSACLTKLRLHRNEGLKAAAERICASSLPGPQLQLTPVHPLGRFVMEVQRYPISISLIGVLHKQKCKVSARRDF